MKSKYVIKGLVLILLIGVLSACNKVSIEGSWVEPVPGMPEMEQGFTLEKGGKAVSINMATLQYETWEQKDNLLILFGKSIGNHQTISFSDTLIIEKLTPESLILKQKEVIREYSKDKKGTIKDTIAASKLTPAQKVLTVKGSLRIGHEVRSFTAEGDTVSYWIVDKSGTLSQKYDQITMGKKNGTPVYVELEVVDMGKSDEGFAADYAGVFQVVRINKIGATSKP